jgi:hypothetical protein
VTPTEYRVVWKRTGLRRKSRRFQSLTSAERHVHKLTVDYDPHFYCDPETGYHYQQSGDPEDPGRETCMPPIEDGPHIEQREVTPWQVIR